MRVLMLSWRGPDHPAAGGAEIYTERVLEGLAARGHSVTWLCERAPSRSPAAVRTLDGGRAPWVYLSGWRYLRTHARDFDVVVDQINGAGFLAPTYSRIPVLALIHQTAGEVWRRDGPRALRWCGPEVEALLLRAYRHVPFVTVSRTTLEDVRSRGWTGWADVAYNGIDPPEVPPGTLPKEPVPTLVFLARFAAGAKRLDHALAVHALVRRHLPSARLWVIGRGTPPPRAPDGVTFFPDVPAARRDELLARAWLLVATSVREGWGRMILEAAAVATPCAVYATPGLAEAAGAVEGLTTEPCPEALAEAVGHLLADPAALHARGRQAAGLVGRFAWPRAVDVWEAALHRACGTGAW